MPNDILTLNASIDGTTDFLELDGLELASVDVETNPDEVQMGITCGMSDMCGEDPCLCGATDEYGACACNGFENVSPTITVSSSDAPVVRVVKVGDSYKIIALRSGEADITVNANLKHYGSATQTIHVNVGAPAVDCICAWLIALIVCLAIIVGIIAGICAGVRKIVAFVRKSRNKKAKTDKTASAKCEQEDNSLESASCAQDEESGAND